MSKSWILPTRSIIAGMAGADCIDDLDVIRCGGVPRLFAQAYAPATLGQFLREFGPYPRFVDTVVDYPADGSVAG